MIHDFLVWPRSGPNPADINRFGSHWKKALKLFRFIPAATPLGALWGN